MTARLPAQRRPSAKTGSGAAWWLYVLPVAVIGLALVGVSLREARQSSK